MKKYDSLLSKTINVEFNSMKVNSFKFTDITPTHRFMSLPKRNGRIYDCSVDWTNKEIKGAYPKMSFDEQTLYELLLTGLSVCPMMPNLLYKFDK